MSNKLRFQPIHIDVARNATDDFNPFHDKHRWQRIVANPFSGPIILGFQLECLIENQMHQYRASNGENALLEAHKLRYSNYEFKFVNAVLPGQDIEVLIKESQLKGDDDPVLGNRVSLKADGKLAVAGFKRESSTPLSPATIDLASLGDLNKITDRTFLDPAPGAQDIFLKRKFLTVSNAKNFLSGSLVEQSDYIDELDERINFPETFPCALLSSALLERAWQQGHDFEREPMVYRSHNLSVDRECLRQARSNDVLHLLSRHADPAAENHVYDCFGVIGTDRLLFSARIDLMPLAAT